MSQSLSCCLATSIMDCSLLFTALSTRDCNLTLFLGSGFAHNFSSELPHSSHLNPLKSSPSVVVTSLSIGSNILVGFSLNVFRQLRHLYLNFDCILNPFLNTSLCIVSKTTRKSPISSAMS